MAIAPADDDDASTGGPSMRNERPVMDPSSIRICMTSSSELMSMTRIVPSRYPAATTSRAGDWTRTVTGDGEDGVRLGNVWMSEPVRMFHSCSSPSRLPRSTLLRYVAGCMIEVAVNEVWKVISLSSSPEAMFQINMPVPSYLSAIICSPKMSSLPSVDPSGDS